ncbi:hypothetical protein N481_13720 [Pseudoalteromonas luteoviolacea S4047-1]|uniref:Aldoketomutase n=2 Tax=Pseudoalteromonas luteoviolacea TaxID=43657 RepID=A0A0F6AA19_9GAMM|nr:hypothetical protein N479_16715 [Pseudoalteromonas luteoviolacea S4054]KZN72907.1 hypothetical protein N481_13720 [Pseudoalteromonas luteoviolacea S4047-1]
MIRVQDLKRSIQFYHEVFGLEVVRRIEFEGFSLTYLANQESDFELELTYNFDRVERYHLGDGYGHLAFSTYGIKEIWEKARLKGYTPADIKTLYKQNDLVARFFFVSDPDGYQIEVIESNDIFS